MADAPRARGALPLIGHLPFFLGDKLGFLSDCARNYGDVVELALGGRTFLLTNPADIGHVLVNNASNYGKSPRISSARGQRVGGVSLITSIGQQHQRLRKPLLPAMRSAVIEACAPLIRAEAEQVGEQWRTRSDVDASAAMRTLALRCAVKVLLGQRTAERHPELFEAIETRRLFMLSFYGSPLPYPEIWPLPLNRRYARLRPQAERIIEEAAGDCGDEPSVLADLCRAAPWASGIVSRAEMLGQFFTLLVSAYETTADFLAWSWWALAHHRECEEAIVAEVKADGAKTAIGRVGFEYTARFLAEVLRLYPPTWMFVRVAHEADQLPGGVTLPAGAKVYLSQWVTHRDARYFPEPERFDPARFERGRSAQRPQLAYFPFGAGARLCVGETFAKMTAQLALTTILQQIQIAAPPKDRIVPRPLVTLSPSLPIRIAIAARA